MPWIGCLEAIEKQSRDFGCQLGCQWHKNGPAALPARFYLGLCNALKRWCQEPGSNRRPHNFQSCALPTELSWQEV